jgi:hypothetical protein
LQNDLSNKEIRVLEDQADSQQPLTIGSMNVSKQAVETLVAMTGGVRQSIGDSIVDVYQALAGDRIRQWRMRCLITNLEKTARFMKERGIRPQDARPLPDGELYSMFEGLSKTEDDAVSSLWASLLVSALDPNTTTSATKHLTSVLERMTGRDALLFGIIASDIAYYDAKSVDEKVAETGRPGIAIHRDNLRQLMLKRGFNSRKSSEDEVQNLTRLILIRRKTFHRVETRLDGLTQVGIPKAVEKALEGLRDMVEELRGDTRNNVVFSSEEEGQSVIQPFELTPFGTKLAKACDVFKLPSQV